MDEDFGLGGYGGVFDSGGGGVEETGYICGRVGRGRRVEGAERPEHSCADFVADGDECERDFGRVEGVHGVQGVVVDGPGEVVDVVGGPS